MYSVLSLLLLLILPVFMGESCVCNCGWQGPVKIELHHYTFFTHKKKIWVLYTYSTYTIHLPCFHLHYQIIYGCYSECNRSCRCVYHFFPPSTNGNDDTERSDLLTLSQHLIYCNGTSNYANATFSLVFLRTNPSAIYSIG